MKISNVRNNISLLIGMLILGSVICTKGDDDQPQSTIDPQEDSYAAINDDSTEIDLSTSETPIPLCPDDPPDGDPDYYWDFGPLDGQDNGNGNATILTDVEASYDVTVFCEQTFINSDGEEYVEDTQTSE